MAEERLGKDEVLLRHNRSLERAGTAGFLPETEGQSFVLCTRGWGATRNRRGLGRAPAASATGDQPR